MIDVEVSGVEDFVRVANAFKGAAELRGLKKELREAIAEAVDPMVDEVRDHVSQYLPDRYAGIIARSLVVKQSWRTSGSSVGLKIAGHAPGVTKRRHLRVINRGNLRHKVYGNPEVWVDQSVKPGFWDEPLKGSEEIPAREIRAAVSVIAAKIEAAARG